MDFRDPRVQKISLIVISLIVVGYFWNARVYAPNAQKIEQKTAEREQLVTKLKSVEMKARSLEELKMEYGGLLERYHEIEALLPEVKQIPSFLVQLHTASSLSGSKITIIDSQKVVTESFYNTVMLYVELTGTYHTFGQFISYIANFPFITNVSDMTIKSLRINPGVKNDKKYGNETMVAKFKLSIYYVRPSSRLSELVFSPGIGSGVGKQ